MNDYTCTCNCGCENSSGEHLCHNCWIDLYEIRIKKNGGSIIVKAKTQVKKFFILCYNDFYNNRTFYIIYLFWNGTLNCKYCKIDLRSKTKEFCSFDFLCATLNLTSGAKSA